MVVEVLDTYIYNASHLSLGIPLKAVQIIFAIHDFRHPIAARSL
jgi:hypothetical protein